MSQEEDEIKRRLASLPPLSPTEVTPLGRIIPTELPPIKEVTSIEGITPEELARKIEAESAAMAYLTPEELDEALKREDELLDEKMENADRRNGMMPLRLIAKYKMQIGIGTGIAAVGGLLIKGCL